MRSDTTVNNFFGFDSTMKVSLISSAIFHVLLFFLTAVGLPFIMPEPVDVTPPITVEFVEIDKVTQTPKIAPPKPVEEKQKPPEVAEEKPKPEPPKEEPPPPKETPKEPPKPEVVPDPDKKVEVPKEKPKPPEKKEEKKEVTKVEKEEPKKDFASLLKDLTPEEKKEEKPRETTFQDILDETAPDTPITRLGDKLTLSEMDALRHQLAQCWSVLAGAKYAEDLVVEVRATINRDRTLAQASILDQGRYTRDSHFRAAADAAMRALRNPRCTPLAVPPEKYEEWKTTVIVFNPSEML